MAINSMNCISQLHASFEDARWMYLEQEVRFIREPQVVSNRQRATEDCFNFLDREAAKDKEGARRKRVFRRRGRISPCANLTFGGSGGWGCGRLLKVEGRICELRLAV